VEDDGKAPRWEVSFRSGFEDASTLPLQAPDVILKENVVSAVGSAVVSSADPRVQQAVGAAAHLPADGSATFLVWSSPDGSSHAAVVQHSPFRVDSYTNGRPTAQINARGQFYFEHRQVSPDGSMATQGSASGSSESGTGRKILDWGEDGKPIYADDDGEGGAESSRESDASRSTAAVTSDGFGSESFGGHTDGRPFGPTSVGVDTVFPGAKHVYGIPEHADKLSLRSTVEGTSEEGAHNEPYRLYNLDVFEYELHNPMALYGSIPMMVAHSASHTAGVFWNNPSETFVDVIKSAESSAAHWMSESGIFDLTVLSGPTVRDVVRQYTTLTGTQALPPKFALGYHQCRWNYKDEADVFGVDAKFEEHAFPYDVLWLDIEHTDGKRYFSWDSHLFPNPAAMQERLAERGRKMVTIIDPHIKRDSGWKIHSEATSKGLYIKNKDGADFDGWCWPGSSSYLDFTNERVRDWWSEQFSYSNYRGSTKHLFTWNDMNEPSVFNGPEVSMSKEAQSLDGVEHREWHNLYGFYQQMATSQGQTRRDGGNTRPFVLSRAFFAGSQRYGAIWTGDNAANWDHLRMSAPMLMSIGLTGLTFAGADVGGFFENPDAELFTRWFEAGAYQPFFRGHAHIDTKRREPWLFGDGTLAQLRSIARTRYALLPFWYTQMYLSHSNGMPVMRPLWTEFPTDEHTFAMEHQWMLADALLVHPVTEAGVTSASVYLPSGQPWFRAETFTKHLPGTHTVDAPLGTIPVFQRGGSIIPKQIRPRRCSQLMQNDPFTLTIAVDDEKSATGFLYLDDGSSLDFQSKGMFRLRHFHLSKGSKLSSIMAAGSKSFAVPNAIERIEIVGLGKAPSSVTRQEDSAPIQFSYDHAKDLLVLRKPGVKAAYDFTILLAE
jgi:mannosyl-oligosaccharide alpha-1,3-glucosidase